MVLTLLRTMLSSTATAATAAPSSVTATSAAPATTAQWKWEVNHDGAVLAYQGSSAPSAPSAPEAPSGRKEHVPRSRTSLVDYWYLVHDGVVIPTVNDH